MTNLLKYLLSAVCIAYVLWGLDLRQVPDLLRHMSAGHLLVAQCILLTSLVPTVLRLSLVAGGVRRMVAFRAALICAAVNSAFPARMGELAKLMVLKREGPMPMGQATGAVFWERFADLNCLLAIGLTTAAALDVPLALLPIVSVVAVLWLGLAWLKLKPHHARAIIARLPWKGLREFLDHTMHGLASNRGTAFYLRLALLTLAYWAIFTAFFFYLLTTAPGLGLTAAQIMTVVVAAILGVAIPAAPSGLGVYESLVVGALVLAGVPKGEALALALILHIMQALPFALLGFTLMAGSPYRPRELRDDPEPR